ncbi:hypothetical protein Vretimale_12764 [Volvox reticuliferus]|uniref:Uncharacterized protein n=1 Tax=Volvox reticuliferus TaxID=1737510 RepID=A0A8J4GK03_9CHLO|nr:hypothetical protein Vretimale_12764 [Volvox reticuliferus]
MGERESLRGRRDSDPASGGWFQFRSVRDLEPGTEVCICYCEAGNEEQLFRAIHMTEWTSRNPWSHHRTQRPTVLRIQLCDCVGRPSWRQRASGLHPHRCPSPGPWTQEHPACCPQWRWSSRCSSLGSCCCWVCHDGAADAVGIPWRQRRRLHGHQVRCWALSPRLRLIRRRAALLSLPHTAADINRAQLGGLRRGVGA